LSGGPFCFVFLTRQRSSLEEVEEKKTHAPSYHLNPKPKEVVSAGVYKFYWVRVSLDLSALSFPKLPGDAKD
jgi:hypothetical protein